MLRNQFASQRSLFVIQRTFYLNIIFFKEIKQVKLFIENVFQSLQYYVGWTLNIIICTSYMLGIYCMKQYLILWFQLNNCTFVQRDATITQTFQFYVFASRNNVKNLSFCQRYVSFKNTWFRPRKCRAYEKPRKKIHMASKTCQARWLISLQNGVRWY